MIDYRGLEALYTVQELQSFEKAAKKLHITQSAVSQRIKALESFYGEPLLVRTLPYRTTKLGEKLIAHFMRLCLLEDTLSEQIEKHKKRPHVSIALNRDSLETWFLDALKKMPLLSEITLDVIADDQELTIDYLKNGLVSACVSTSEKEIPGGAMTFLGEMEYLLVAAPQFYKKHFSQSFKKGLNTAPALKFDKNDRLHERYLEKFFHIRDKEFFTSLPFQIIPSVRGFKEYACLGYGYGLLPKIDIEKELQQKKLALVSDHVWRVPLYWHYWEVNAPFYKKFNYEIIQFASKRLKFKV